jgi:magnesium transporter
MLDTRRNKLILFELKLAMGTMGLTSGALIAGFFGMNLHTGLEHAPSVWVGIAGVSCATAGSVIYLAGRRLNRLFK